MVWTKFHPMATLRGGWGASEAQTLILDTKKSKTYHDIPQRSKKKWVRLTKIGSEISQAALVKKQGVGGLPPPKK